MINCGYCGDNLKREKFNESKSLSGRFFCNSSCAAKYNNPVRVYNKPAKPVCKNCDKPIRNGVSFCSSYCSGVYKHNQVVNDWQQGRITGLNSIGLVIPPVRNYLMEKAGYKCIECEWCERNPVTGRIPLHIDHIDGNYLNNVESNLRVLCPNCHSLTPNYGSLNRGKGRKTKQDHVV